jgi:hypothetical protein
VTPPLRKQAARLPGLRKRGPYLRPTGSEQAPDAARSPRHGRSNRRARKGGDFSKTRNRPATGLPLRFLARETQGVKRF